MKLDKNYKVRVNPKQSRKIQELVFGLGGKWNGGTDWVINEIIPFLYVTSGLVMTCDSKAQEYFGYASSENTEIQADDLIALLTDLSKSEESLVQDMELTSEFETEASEPKFKVGDKVYIPNIKNLCTIRNDGKVITSDGQYYCNLSDSHDLCFVLATQENYEMLCKLYPHIEFEAPPKELTGSDLARAMLDKGWKYVPCYVHDGSDDEAINRKHYVSVKNETPRSGYNFSGTGANDWKYAVPIDPRTGEPLTESILND